MTTLDQYAGFAAYKLCFFGRAKVGKTALVAALAKIWKLHWFDLENGVTTLLNPKFVDPSLRQNINLFPIRGKQTAPMGIETLLKVVKGGPQKICWNHGKVNCPACLKIPEAIHNTIDINTLTNKDCLVIDSTTQLSMEANAASIAFALKDAEKPEDFVFDKDTGAKNFKFPMAVNMMLDKIFSTLQTAPFNVAVISHEVMTERTKDTAHVVGAGQNQPSDNIEVIFPAAGSRNYSRNFGRFFDALIHVDIVNKQHRAFSSSTYSSSVQTGCRLSANLEDMVGADKKPLPPAEALVKLFGDVKPEVIKP